MTAARRKRKARAGRAVFGLAAGLIVLSAGAGSAGVTERVVSNRFTGLAIHGFDPVAYFTDAAPKQGRAGLELNVGGAIWRFANEGNRAAFAAAPEVYRPRFGGYDPTAIARGVAAAGHPGVWLIVHRRLYLFYDEAARAAFLTDPDAAIEAAERHWPEVRATLAP